LLQAQPLRGSACPWHNLAAQVNRLFWHRGEAMDRAAQGRYLFDALVSVGHDFGIEIDGFRIQGI
jgi:hypothetical protein